MKFMGLITDIAINGNKARKIDDIGSMFDLDNITAGISDSMLTRYRMYYYRHSAEYDFSGNPITNVRPQEIMARIKECIVNYRKDICRLILKWAVPMMVHMYGQNLFDGNPHYYSRLKGHSEAPLTRLINKAVPEGIRNINHLGWPGSFEFEVTYNATRYRRNGSDVYTYYTQIKLYPRGTNPDQYRIIFEIPQEL